MDGEPTTTHYGIRNALYLIFSSSQTSLASKRKEEANKPAALCPRGRGRPRGPLAAYDILGMGRLLFSLLSVGKSASVGWRKGHLLGKMLEIPHGS